MNLAEEVQPQGGTRGACETRNLLARNTIGFWHLIAQTIVTSVIYPFWLTYRLLQNQI